MKYIIFAVLLLTISAYSIITFEKTLGGEKDDEANSIRLTADGGYIIACAYTDSLYSTRNMTLVKTDSLGKQEWSKMFNGFNEGYSAIETSDEGYIISGYLSYWAEMMGLLPHIFIVKTDKNGDKEWSYHYPDGDGWYVYEAFDIIQTTDGGYAATGRSNFGSWICKLRPEGEEEWISHNGEMFEQGHSIIQTQDKGFIISGRYSNHPIYDVILYKTDSLGTQKWYKRFGSENYDEGSFSFALHKEDIFIAGYTDSLGNGGKDAWLIKTDSLGNEIWNKTYGGASDDIAYSIDNTSDGNLIIAGSTGSFGDGGIDAWLIKADINGNELWSKTFGGPGNDELKSVQQTLDGGYILAGYTDSFGAGGKDMWIIKTDENGTEIESPFLPQTAELHQNYPNPFNPSTDISYSLKTEGMVTLSVFNTKGEIVRTPVNERKTAGNHSINFNGEGLNSGIYFYKLEVNGSSVGSKRMLLIK